MQYRQLGHTGLFVSRLCLGTMTFGGAGTPPYDLIGGLSLADAQRMVDTSLDAGINFIDTADVYASGESETLVGQALRGRRRDVVLATKFNGRVGPGPNAVGQSRVHLMDALEGSLQRLQTDHIDLYQIHNFDHLTRPEESLRALDDAVRQGKIRYIGCSNLAAWQIARSLGVSALHGWSAFVSVQACYSLASRDIEREIVPLVADQALALMAWSPLAGGLLSGKFDREGATDSGARRAHLQFPPVEREQGFAIIDALKAVALRQSTTVARIALAWVLAQPAVTCAIVGAKRLDQLTDNLAAIDVVLSVEDLAQLDAVSALPPAYPDWMQVGARSARLPRPNTPA